MNYYAYLIIHDRLLRKFTLQSLLATAFGFNVNILKGETHEIAETADSIFFNNTTMISIFWADTFGCKYFKFTLIH